MKEIGKSRAIITGATGFIGYHLASRLVADGWVVHAIVRPQSMTLPLMQLGQSVTIHRHYGSTAEMIDIVKEAKPDIVFHLASLFLAQHQPRDLAPMIQSNVTFGAQLLEAMAANGANRLINTGTSWQHYEGKDYSPVCLYAATKQAFEAVLAYYVETTPLQAITLKLFDTYGPHDDRPKLFQMLQKALREQKDLLMSPGEQLIDLVYIEDVVRAYLIAADRLLDGKAAQKCETFAVSSGNPRKLKDIVAAFENVTGKKLPIVWGGRPYRPREVMAPWDKGNTLPGWQPLMDLEAGMKKLGL